MNELVDFYKLQITGYIKLFNKQIMADIDKQFIEFGILDKNTSLSPLHVYLAMWLNLPVRKGAKWTH